VNLASSCRKLRFRIGSLRHEQGRSAYHALSVARDFINRGIRCNCVCRVGPHAVVDGSLRKTIPVAKGDVRELSAAQPIGRMGQPDEIAGLVAYLCADEASFVTVRRTIIDVGHFAEVNSRRWFIHDFALGGLM